LEPENLTDSFTVKLAFSLPAGFVFLSPDGVMWTAQRPVATAFFQFFG
jgi:hypothetical protein